MLIAPTNRDDQLDAASRLALLGVDLGPVLDERHWICRSKFSFCLHAILNFDDELHYHAKLPSCRSIFVWYEVKFFIQWLGERAKLMSKVCCHWLGIFICYLLYESYIPPLVKGFTIYGHAGHPLHANMG